MTKYLICVEPIGAEDYGASYSVDGRRLTSIPAIDRLPKEIDSEVLRLREFLEKSPDVVKPEKITLEFEHPS